MLDPVIEFLSEKVGMAIHESWVWFNSLSREEWTIVLGVGCVLGFIIIQGLGKKHRV